MTQKPAMADYKAADEARLESLRSTIVGSARQRLILWAVRWALGFCAIGVIAYFWPGLTWLFWVGLAVAATSLVLTLSLRAVALKRIDRASRRLDA